MLSASSMLLQLNGCTLPFNWAAKNYPIAVALAVKPKPMITNKNSNEVYLLDFDSCCPLHQAWSLRGKAPPTIWKHIAIAHFQRHIAAGHICKDLADISDHGLKTKMNAEGIAISTVLKERHQNVITQTLWIETFKNMLKYLSGGRNWKSCLPVTLAQPNWATAELLGNRFAVANITQW